jgi:uncharacterized protein
LPNSAEFGITIADVRAAAPDPSAGRAKIVVLLGPRQTGKSTLLRQALPEAVFVDLLETDTFRDLSRNPELLRQRLRPIDRWIVVDEVQKLPSLLDEVHALIERNKSLRFVLTGSSARKLKRGQANLSRAAPGSATCTR